MKAEQIRNSHLKKFERISPEEKIFFSLSYGYFLFNLLPKNKKRDIIKYRNAWKKRRISTGNL